MPAKRPAVAVGLAQTLGFTNTLAAQRMSRDQRTAPHVRKAKRYWLVPGAKNTSGVDTIRTAERWPLIVEYSGHPDGVAKVVAAGVTKRHLWQVERHGQLIFDTSASVQGQSVGPSTGVPKQATKVIAEDEESRFPEGPARYALHRRLERDTTLARRVKEKRLALAGKLDCQVCGFDFEQEYGSHGRGFIEAHHTTPVSKLTGSTRTAERDLILVCSNCHRMLHFGSILLTPDELITMRRARK